jgi:hypothetical protein
VPGVSGASKASAGGNRLLSAVAPLGDAFTLIPEYPVVQPRSTEPTSSLRHTLLIERPAAGLSAQDDAHLQLVG